MTTEFEANAGFKALGNYELTNIPPAKQFYEELQRPSLKLRSTQVWTDVLDPVDPSVSVTAGHLELRTLFALTEDITVPGSKTWKAIDGSQLTDWTDPSDGSDPDPTTSPYRVRIFDGTDAEVFPTDPSLPYFNPKTGILFFEGPVTRPTPFKITAYRYIGSVLSDGAGIDFVAAATQEALTISVDHDDVNAVVLTPGQFPSFASQAQIDAALGGETSFKYIQDVLDRLPAFALHNIAVNCAAGVHYVRPGDTVALEWKTSVLRGISGIYGALGGATQVIAPQTITSNTTTGDPTVGVAGTPFAGVELEGLFARFDNGFLGPIHDHDDSSLRMCNRLLPAPSNGVTTVEVVRLGTIFRNAYESAPNAQAVSFRPYRFGGTGLNNISDTYFETWYCEFNTMGSFVGISDNGAGQLYKYLYACSSNMEEQRVDTGLAPAGRHFQTFDRWYLERCSTRVVSGQIGSADQGYLSFGGSLVLVTSYASPTDGDKCVEIINTPDFQFTNSVCGGGAGMSLDNSKMVFNTFFSGVNNEIRGASADGLLMTRGSQVLGSSASVFFNGASGDGVQLESGSIFEPSAVTLTAASITGVGLRMEDVRCSGLFSAAGAGGLTGGGGDVNLNGVVDTWANYTGTNGDANTLNLLRVT